MDTEVRAAAERLILIGEMYETMCFDKKYANDLLLVARYALSATERPKGDAAEIDQLRELVLRLAGLIERGSSRNGQRYLVHVPIGYSSRAALEEVASLGLASPSPSGDAAEIRAAIGNLLKIGPDEPLMDDPSYDGRLRSRYTFWFCGGTIRAGHAEDCPWQALVNLASPSPSGAARSGGSDDATP